MRAGIVSAGAMGSALGAALRAGCTDVVTRVAGRSERTARLAHDAGLTRLPVGVDLIRVGDEAGTVSAVKMSTASVYKGSVALLVQALLTVRANGVLESVVDELAPSGR